MKRIIAISDTHNKHHDLDIDLEKMSTDDDLNENTIIIHGGDISMSGTKTEILNFLNWYSNLPFKHKVFIAGNHDFGFEMVQFWSEDEPIYVDIAQEFKDKGVVYLMDQMVEIDGLKIYGSPWQPRFYDWAFNVERGDAIAKKWDKIPEGIDVLITHGPPFGILDYTYTSQRVGCEELYKKVVAVHPKIHIFGHIHFGYGYKEFDGMSFFNAASLGERYFYLNKPISILLDNENEIIDILV